MDDINIQSEPVIHPAAWKTTDFYSVDDLAFDLDDRDVKAGANKWPISPANRAGTARGSPVVTLPTSHRTGPGFDRGDSRTTPYP